MTNCINNKKQATNPKDGVPTAYDGGVKLLGMKHLKVIEIKIGKEGKKSYGFSPSIDGVPKEFFILPDIVWRTADVEDLCGSLRQYVAELRAKGESVEVAVADSDVVRLDLTLDGENRRLWFNARTSDTVALDANGNVCKNIRELIQDPNAKSLSERNLHSLTSL